MKPQSLLPPLRSTLLLGLVLALVPVSVGAEPRMVSVEEAIDLALQSSLDIFGQGQSVAAALRNLENRWNLFLPSISAGLSFRRSDKLVTEFPLVAATSSDSLFSSTFNLGTRVSLATGVLFDLEKRRTDYRAALLSERESVAKVSKEVTKAYYALVSLGQDLENKERAIVLAEERLRLASFRFDRGLGPELDVLRAQLSVQTAKSVYERTRAENEKRFSAFKRLLGLEGDTKLSLTSAIHIGGLKPQLDSTRLIEGRSDLERGRSAITTAETEVKRFLATIRMPLVSLEADWAFRKADSNPSRDSYTIGASLTFNADAWIPNSRRDLELRSLRENQERLALKYEQDRRNAIELVNGLMLEISQAATNVSLAESQVLLSERVYAGTRTAYERGMATALQLETDSAAVDTARQALISSRYQYLALLIDLGYELGTDWRTLIQ